MTIPTVRRPSSPSPPPAPPRSRASPCSPSGQTASPLAAGRGRLGFALVDGATALVRGEAASPLQILSPRRRGRSAWAFLIGHGGGLVAGDDVDVEVEVGAGATALLSTQAETKVYRAPSSLGASQRLMARLGPGSTLAVLPEPVSLFAGSRYEQRQRFDLAAGASLLALDATVSGRSALGERWALARYRSSSEVFLGGRLVLGDALALGGNLAARMGRFEGFASAVALGPAFARGARALLAQLASRPVERGAEVLAAASPLADGALLRCAAGSAEGLSRFLREALAFAAAPLGGDPFAHKW